MGVDLRKVKGKIFYTWDSGAHLGSRCALGRKHCPTREDRSLQAGLRPRKTQLLLQLCSCNSLLVSQQT